jgi:lipoprotein-anchoring transpeptidase ErfK/SrfK
VRLSIAVFLLLPLAYPASAQQSSPVNLVAPLPMIETQPLPPIAAPTADTEGDGDDIRADLKRQEVSYSGPEFPGTIIIDTAHTHLLLVLEGGKAMRYGIGVGREGFTWSGRERVSRMAEWPDWYPPKEMIERQPYLPRIMAGGPGNPLGARALYLGSTLYRIHGTNQPDTIGKYVSSGCIRLVNDDIEDLYGRVRVGAQVVVLQADGSTPPAAPAPAPKSASSRAAAPVLSNQPKSTTPMMPAVAPLAPKNAAHVPMPKVRPSATQQVDNTVIAKDIKKSVAVASKRTVKIASANTKGAGKAKPETSVSSEKSGK